MNKLVMLALLAVLPGMPGEAGPPAEFVRGRLERFETLSATTEGGERLTRLKQELEGVFDLDGFAARTLGSRWSALSGAQQSDFRAALRALMENRYLGRDAIFGRHHVAIEGETALAEKEVRINGTIRRKDVEIQVGLILFPAGDTWKVRDVIVDELSLQESYRTQFLQFLGTRGPDELIRVLRERAAAFAAPKAGRGAESVNKDPPSRVE